MIPSELQPLANHLWQSSLVAALAWLLTLAFQRNRAADRYWLWFAASVKFLIPFSLLVYAGGQFAPQIPAATGQPAVSAVVVQMAMPFAAAPSRLPAARPSHGAPGRWIPGALAAVWAMGFVWLISSWCWKWRTLSKAIRAAEIAPLPIPIRAITGPAFLEPAVFGIFRPVLLLPLGITGRLTPAQWEAIVRHELCHVRRRDNLVTALHMAVEALFWFHPLVWWLGGRLVAERERTCDEEVVRQGSDPEVYAQGILKVCELYLESPLACLSGVTGANLRGRIEAIMANATTFRPSLWKKAALGAVAAAVLAAPVMVGLATAPATEAQTQANAPQEKPLSFDSASVQIDTDKSDTGHHHHQRGSVLTMTNVTLKYCIEAAYGVADNRVIGGPAWIESERYDITAKALDDGIHNQAMLRLQTLLKERFQLELHRENREGPVYELSVARKGIKVKEETDRNLRGGVDSDKFGDVQFTAYSMDKLAKWLERSKVSVDRPVIDKTGLTGFYTFHLVWTPDEPEAGQKSDEGAAIIAALNDQAGLKLEPRKGPIEVLVIDRASKPTAN